MKKTGERIGGDYLPHQRLGGEFHLRARAERTIGNSKSGKVARSRVRWQRGARLSYQGRSNEMAERGRRERQAQEGGRRNT